MTRRSTHVSATSVTYGAVGASQDPNVVRFPPEGFVGHYEEVLIGRGEVQFQKASDALLSWGAQRDAGIEVTDVHTPSQSSYRGVEFDDAGNALAAKRIDEQVFTASGESFVTAGMTATLSWPNRRASRNIRIVYTIDEAREKGFALGTLDEDGVIGEECFCVEMRPDGTVWAYARGFLAAPESGWLGLKQLTLVKLAIASTRKQLRALAIPNGQAHQNAEI